MPRVGAYKNTNRVRIVEFPMRFWQRCCGLEFHARVDQFDTSIHVHNEYDIIAISTRGDIPRLTNPADASGQNHAGREVVA